MQKQLMKCGHIANATCEDKPCCVICTCFEVDKKINDDFLNNRTAKCTTCGKESKSKVKLPFFEYLPNKDFDSYYCGCWGWD